MPYRYPPENVEEMIKKHEESKKRVDIDKPRWDQSTYWGRVRHFWVITNPLNLLYSDKELNHSKEIVERYRRGENFLHMTDDELWRYKHMYDSAFHPDTGEKTFIIGRISSQVPVNMFITGFMLTFYKTLPAVLFWQWINQSFNAITNYCNRSGNTQLEESQILTSYAAATSGAIVTAVGLNRMANKFPPVVGRLVPFAAIAGANAVNLPLSRRSELVNGMKISDENDQTLGFSKRTAKIGIAQVVLSRVCMAVPSMVCIPLMMNRLEKSGFLKKNPKFPLPFQVAACGTILLFSTPMCCAIFPQKASIPVTWLERDLQESINKMPDPPKVVYYNKGL